MVGRVGRVYLLSAPFPILFACDREGPPGPPSGGAVAPASPEGHDAPVRALYLRGNRFVLSNAQPFPVPVTWRIQGADEQGDLTLAAAPDGAISGSARSRSPRAIRGPLELYRGDQLLAVRDNDLTSNGVPSKARIIRLR